MSTYKRPTRRDLLIVVGRLQDAIGGLIHAYDNDRAQDRAAAVHCVGDPALQLAIDARSFDPPINGRSRNGWDGAATEGGKP